MENSAFEKDQLDGSSETIIHRSIAENQIGRHDAVAKDTRVPQSNLKTEQMESIDTDTNTKPDQFVVDGPVELKRRVGLFSGIALIVGTMIGSGIFISAKVVLERSGSPGLSIVVWFGCGLLSLLGALSYSELGTLIPGSGGAYVYFLELTRSKNPGSRSFWRPVPAFLFGWLLIILLKPASLAIICMTSAQYFVRLFRVGCDPNFTNFSEEFSISIKLIAAIIMVLITAINIVSVNLATKVQNIFTAAKLLAVLMIVVGGMIKLAQGNVQNLSQGFQGSSTNVGNIATAFYSGLWAYDGWNNLNYITEELKNPYTNLPRAIAIGLPLVTISYVMVSVSYLAVMSTDEFLASETTAVLFGQRIMGSTGEIILIIAVVMSTFGAANGSCFTAGRLCFVAAREGHMVNVLSYVHYKNLTPAPALLLNALIAMLLIIPSNIGSLINFFSFTAWLVHGAVMVTLIIMRRTKKDSPRPYKVPIVIPWIVLLVSIYLVIGPIIDRPQIEYLFSAMFIVAGLIFYVPLVYMHKSVPGVDNLSIFLQIILQAIPTNVKPNASNHKNDSVQSKISK